MYICLFIFFPFIFIQQNVVRSHLQRHQLALSIGQEWNETASIVGWIAKQCQVRLYSLVGMEMKLVIYSDPGMIGKNAKKVFRSKLNGLKLETGWFAKNYVL